MAGPAAQFDPFAAAGWTSAPATNDNATAAPPSTPSSDDLAGVPIVHIRPAASYSGTTAVRVPAAPPLATPDLDATMARLRAGQPPATAPDANDPFVAAGWVGGSAAIPPPPASQIPATTAPPPPPRPAWYQPIHDAVRGVVQSFQAVPPEGSGPLAAVPGQGATQSLQHGFTMGLDEILAPLIPAAAESAATGKPFSQVYDDVVQQMRKPRAEFEQSHPYAATALSLAGSLPTAELTAPLFSGVPAATRVGQAVNLARNIVAGGAAGAAGAFGMTDGDIQARLRGAESGAELGGGLSAFAPVAGAVATRLNTALRPNAAVDPLAGAVLRERAGLAPGAPTPAPEAPALPGMPLGVGGAFNSPGLAAQERLVNATDDAGAIAQRTAQNASIRDAAAALPTGAPGATLPEPAEASANAVRSLQRAHGVLKDEEERLWTAPALNAARPNAPLIRERVRQAIAALPQRFQQAIERNADVRNALADLERLGPNATLADVNQARSDILAASRALPYAERFAKRAADDAGRAMLRAIESDPALRTNAAAMAAYQRARDFTRNMHEALEKPQFQRMLQAIDGNRKGLDPGTLANEMFKFAAGTERTPQGLQRVLGMLDDVRRTWTGLAAGNAGVPLPGLTPAAAQAARTELAQGAREFVVSKMLDAASSNVRDQAGAQNLLMNKLSDWIDTNRTWIGRSGLFSQPQLDLLDRIRDASVQAQRTANLRGGAGSETFERLKGDRYIDAFMGPFLGRVSGVGMGALAGALATHLFGEAAIGGMIGTEIVGAAAGHAYGPTLLQRIYAVPRARLMERLNEAVRDPALAADLMRRAGEQLSPATRAWARSLLASAPAEQAARTLTPPAGGQP